MGNFVDYTSLWGNNEPNIVDRKDFYEYDKPEFKERTKNRLSQIVEMGMTEIGIASFGIEGIMSGLYIEKVWNYSDEDWDSYIDWVKSLLNKK